MSNKKYSIQNLSISNRILSILKINIVFYLDIEQQIDLNDLTFHIKSVEIDENYSYDDIRSFLIESIQLFSKFVLINVDISFVSNAEDCSNMICYSFPGCYPNQSVDLMIDCSQFSPSDSVVIFAFDRFCPPHLLFVNHQNRGWELPGGKLELNETEIDAIIRETREEGATELVCNSIQSIAQYQFFDENQLKIHRKTVFVGIIDSVSDTLLSMETIGKKIILPPKWTDDQIFNPNLNYSQLLKDNVYTICLQLAIKQILPNQ